MFRYKVPFIICILLTAFAGTTAGQDSSGVRKLGGFYNKWESANGVVANGKLVYVATGSSGLVILYSPSPDTLWEISYLRTPSSVYKILLSGQSVYLAGRDSLLRVIDVADSSNPHEIGSCLLPGTILDMIIEDNHIYASVYPGGLKIIDVTDVGSPAIVGGYEITGEVHAMVRFQHYICLHERGKGLHVIDVSEPENPQKAGYVFVVPRNWGDIFHTLAMRSDTVLAISRDRCTVIKISEPPNPIVLEGASIKGGDMRSEVRGNFLYAPNEYDSTVRVTDISRLTNPEWLTSIKTGTVVKGISLVDSLVFVAGGGRTV